MYTGGGSLGVEIERHVGGSDGYVMIEKAIERPDFVFLYEGAIKQTVTAPKAGRYTITAVGAKGGNCLGCNLDTCEKQLYEYCYSCQAQFNEGGYGALARGTFLLSEGDEIEVLVAGKGGDCETVTLQNNRKRPSDSTELRYPRGYNQVYTGCGGGGASSATIKHADGRGENLLLIAGGGGGAARFFHGEDGEIGPNGGWAWGGAFGGGGRIPPIETHDECSEISDKKDAFVCKNKIRTTGAGGGGEYGNGASYIITTKDGYNGREDLAEGGFSLLNGGRGGFFDWEYEYVDKPNSHFGTISISGGSGGSGGGGQGGACKYIEVVRSSCCCVQKAQAKTHPFTADQHYQA